MNSALPKPSCHLTYTGDVTHMIGEVKGPNAFGEWFTAVDAEYDPITQQTRVGLAIGIHGEDAAAANRAEWQRFLTALHLGRQAGAQ